MGHRVALQASIYMYSTSRQRQAHKRQLAGATIAVNKSEHSPGWRQFRQWRPMAN